MDAIIKSLHVEKRLLEFLMQSRDNNLLFIVILTLPSEAMISWTEFQASMPWKVALLVGGGFALAEGTKVQ